MARRFNGMGTMQRADIGIFAQYEKDIKQSSVIHNIFQDANELANSMRERECMLYKGEKSMFLLVPKHNLFYEILYLSANPDTLKKDLASFMDNYNLPLALRASLIGREQPTESIASLFLDCGFILGRKIARMRNYSDEKDIRDLIALLCEDEICEVGFAVPGEESRILEILAAEFDPRADNLPELPEIRDNIERRQVIVIRVEGRIIALHYFTMRNNICYGWYDVIEKNYRQKHLYLHMMLFQYDYWKDKEALRSYSWRDVNNKRLMALAKQSNQVPDGVYIYNMLYDNKPAGAENA